MKLTDKVVEIYTRSEEVKQVFADNEHVAVEIRTLLVFSRYTDYYQQAIQLMRDSLLNLNFTNLPTDSIHNHGEVGSPSSITIKLVNPETDEVLLTIAG